MKGKFLSLVVTLAASSIGFAQSVKIDKLSIRSRDYTEVEVTKLDEARAMVRHSGGVARVPISDLPDDVRKSLGWKSEEEKKAEAAAKKAEEDARYPRLFEEWDLKDESDRKINEKLREFLESRPQAVVLRMVLVIRGNGAEWRKAFIYDREKKHLLVMTRTTPPKGVTEHYQTFYWRSVPEEELRKGIPWVDEEGAPLTKMSKPQESPFAPPISYKDRPEITEWP
jgi:hypothetical protein